MYIFPVDYGEKVIFIVCELSEAKWLLIEILFVSLCFCSKIETYNMFHL